MQYTATNPEEYLDQLENDWRKEKLLTIRELLLSHGLTEGIAYKMLSYSDEKGLIFSLNAQKAYTALYVGDAEKIDQTGDLLEGVDRGKGCLRFKKTFSIEDSRMDEFIRKAVEMWKNGEDIGC